MQRSPSTIRELNDELRQHLLGGDIVISDKIAALGPKALARLTERLAQFDQFCPFTDPRRKHAFGALLFDGLLVVFRVDHHNLTSTGREPDPADSNSTQRVMTIMLADEYIRSTFVGLGSRSIPAS
jgi:hypothetical protein